MTLTIRTEKPEAEVGLFDENNRIGYVAWQAHRELSTTIHMKIEGLLENAGKRWEDIDGIIFFKGPGSFTGLRIGASVANALASAYDIPVASENGDDWIEKGLGSIRNSGNNLALPEYGADPHITVPRK